MTDQTPDFPEFNLPVRSNRKRHVLVETISAGRFAGKTSQEIADRIIELGFDLRGGETSG